MVKEDLMVKDMDVVREESGSGVGRRESWGSGCASRTETNL